MLLQMGTDRIQTVMGMGEAALVGTMDYFVHSGPDGIDYSAPTFWIGVLIAISRAVKGYFAAGVKPEPVKDPAP